MKVVTAEEMREIDRKTIEKVGIPAGVLMERAGFAVASKIRDLYEKKKTIVLCGGGNNGGDGIVAARELYNSGWNVAILLLIKEDKLSPDCLAQFRVAKKMGIPAEFRTEITAKDLHGAVVVDAMLGTGLNKDVAGAMAKTINFLNASGSPVVSVDIPSGISSDTGQVMGVAVKAGHTVTFGLPKRGHLLYPGAEYTGNLCITNIGFPEDLLTSPDLTVTLVERGLLSALIPDRPAYSHKGDYGHVFIVAGSRGRTGAALMAAKACLRTGAGLVTIGVPETLMGVFQSRVTEEMTLPLPDNGNGSLSAKSADVIIGFLSESADVLSIGPGIGVSEDTEKIMEAVVTSCRAPMVIDADGLNSIGNTGMFRKALAPVILTPHPGEMARLLSKTKTQEHRRRIEMDRIHTALSFAKDSGVTLVLKGVPTVIADPDGRAWINSTGNPGMATAGTGDVLTGMISSFLGQHLTPLNGAILGVYLHGLAGDIAASQKGRHSLVASDIIESIPQGFRDILP
ncbi:MAG TPA: NAD(P)H-hydrate dehydratase [Thermodesulfovibrionales bacterium]|jgi:NAD(P)H-hydrate epimerase|nr:NAD(P)H-hydrate dehydratase [Thermodesulfovibrionales bacterium]